jgi:hypothetical protein
MIAINLDWKGVRSVRLVADSIEDEQKEILLMPLTQHFARILHARIIEQKEKHREMFANDND